jgi:hypothetical protein
MTDETPRPTSEDTPAPPASTRWTEEPLPEDDTLASPFVPGRTADTGAEMDPPFSRPAPAQDAPIREEAAPWEDEPDAFPFDHFDLEGEGRGGEPGETGGAPGGMRGEPGATGGAAEVGAPAADDTDAAGMGWTPADLDLDEAAAATEPPVAGTAAESPAVEDPAGEVAELLERMAALLRSEGVEAVRGEMESSHRLTALLAGLVAGYISGRG